MAIRKANRPSVHPDGFSTGTLAYVKAGTGVRKEKKGRDVEEIEFPRYEFYFEVDGVTGDTLTIKVYTGTVINDEPVEVLAKGRGKNAEVKIYNRLTTMCLKLGFLKEQDLATVTDKQLTEVDNGLLSVEDMPLRFKVGKTPEGFHTIDLNTIEPVKDSV
jgi:hypothetical protein